VLQLPEDPYIVLPENKGSSRDVHAGKLLPSEKAPDALTPAISGVDLSGIWASGSIFRGNANSEGQKHWFATETFAFDYSLVTPEEKMVKATFAGSKWNQSDYESYAALSIQQLEKMKIAPRTIKPGKYRAYIAPAGVADILSMFSWGGVSEASIQQGDSAFLKMRKEKIKLSPLFSLAEDFTTGTVPRFNARGEIATEVLPIINKGVLENTLISSRTAKEYGKKSNNASDWEGMRAPIMSGGGLPETDILKALGTGVYLSNLHYLNWSDRIGGRITGMTRYACFWVENGEIVAPIENMRFDDSIYSFFGPELEAVTEKPQLIPDVGTYEGRELGGIICPGILLKSFDLTL
ncbi:MAG: TldD/PmbA family protein, partial [FCB group bacterium]|nr:TldD/PmbA family protein [FCB group bacterium]